MDKLNLTEVSQLIKTKKVWSKSADNESHKFMERAWDLKMNCDHFIVAENMSEGDMSFSKAVAHGELASKI